MNVPSRETAWSRREYRTLRRLITVLVLLFAFLLGVKGLGDGFKLLGRDLLQAFFAATENPFVGLVVGILATTLVQSSSVTTSMIVGLVAAPENPLPLANAVPMIMGANIGTTVTNTIVSLAHMARREEFRRAFSVATCHDFFNYISVLVLLPLELLTGFLRSIAAFLSSALQGMSGISYESPLKGALGASMAPVKHFAEAVFSSQGAQAAFLIALSALMIFTALYLLVRVMRKAVQTRVEHFISGVLGSSAVLSMLVGALVTVMVQSSSITTSLLVPLAGAGLVTIEQAFPVTIGANIGTTVTALLASLAVSGPHAAAGIQIALIHLLFNLSGTLLIYPAQVIRRVPLGAARWLADAAVTSRKTALIYLALLFYVLPALLIFLDRNFR
ncbi:MAG: Na/Pi symporter [Acidobacteriota bacterium]